MDDISQQEEYSNSVNGDDVSGNEEEDVFVEAVQHTRVNQIKLER